MNSKFLSFGLAVPLAAAGLIGSSGSASAAGLFDPPPAFNQLSISVNFDLLNLKEVRQSDGSLSFIPTVTPPGPIIDFLPPAYPPLATSPINVSGVTNLGGVGFTICNDGNVNSSVCSATIQDFVLDGTTVNPFITVTGSGVAAGTNYNFSLDTSTIDDPTPLDSVLKFTDDGLPGGPSAASCAANPGQTGCAATIDFFAKGKLDVLGSFNGMDVGSQFDVSYSYTGPRILIDGANSESCALATGAMCTLQFLPTTGAGNILVSVNQQVPEPSSVGALLALGAVGSLGFLKRKSLRK